VPKTRAAARISNRTDPEALARCCHALSDQTRLAILKCLAGGEECVCNLTGLCRTGQSRLSFHLKVLKDAGLVRARRDGRWIHYSLVPEGLEAVRSFVERLESRRKP
jgi:ArsR family transcriptional regulator